MVGTQLPRRVPSCDNSLPNRRHRLQCPGDMPIGGVEAANRNASSGSYKARSFSERQAVLLTCVQAPSVPTVGGNKRPAAGGPIAAVAGESPASAPFACVARVRRSARPGLRTPSGAPGASLPAGLSRGRTEGWSLAGLGGRPGAAFLAGALPRANAAPKARFRC
jgi:hypothetical protein